MTRCSPSCAHGPAELEPLGLMPVPLCSPECHMTLPAGALMRMEKRRLPQGRGRHMTAFTVCTCPVCTVAAAAMAARPASQLRHTQSATPQSPSTCESQTAGWGQHRETGRATVCWFWEPWAEIGSCTNPAWGSLDRGECGGTGWAHRRERGLHHRQPPDFREQPGLRTSYPWVNLVEGQ